MIGFEIIISTLKTMTAWSCNILCFTRLTSILNSELTKSASRISRNWIFVTSNFCSKFSYLCTHLINQACYCRQFWFSMTTGFITLSSYVSSFISAFTSLILPQVTFFFWGPPRGKRDGVIRHILERENLIWMEKIALFREWSIWHPAWLGKFGVNIKFRQFLSAICAKKLRESGVSSLPWGPI